MFRAALGTRMREIDSTAINRRGISGEILMERAGESLTDVILNKIEEETALSDKKKITEKTTDCVIVCGGGNNGGDGYVAARLLENAGKKVKLYSLSDPEKLTGDAKLNYQRYIDMKGEVTELKKEWAPEIFKKEAENSLTVVDAVFGTGLARTVEGLAKDVIESINSCSSYTISVDIPSGVSADSGRILGTAVKADCTVTFQMNKYGMCVQPGRDMAGNIIVTDIGLPQDLCDENRGTVCVPEKKDIVQMIPERRTDMNKGNAGKVLIVAGNRGMAGAAVLAAGAAYRSGAGLVRVAAVWDVLQTVQSAIPEATCLILNEDVNNNIEMISEEADNYDAVVIGPGLGKSRETGILVKYLLKNIKKPMVLDADGINLICDEPEILRKCKAPVVLTPHPGEMGRLLGISAGEVNENRPEIAQKFAAEYNIVLVLKGAGSLTACQDGTVYLNCTGNSAMATAGSGDVLSGITGAFLAAGIPAGKAAAAAVYVHGMSGDFCREKIGEHGTIASDIAEKTAEVMKVLTE